MIAAYMYVCIGVLKLLDWYVVSQYEGEVPVQWSVETTWLIRPHWRIFSYVHFNLCWKTTCHSKDHI